METWIPFRSKVFVETTDQICGEAMKLVLVETTTALAIPCYALAESNAEVLHGRQVTTRALVTAAQASGGSGATLEHYKTCRQAFRSHCDREPKSTHTMMTSLVVTEGKATLVHFGDGGKC